MEGMERGDFVALNFIIENYNFSIKNYQKYG
jgi:hypothetical protein